MAQGHTWKIPEWTRRYHSLDIAEKAFGGSVEITLTDGTVITDEIAVADAHPLGARPFAREQYVNKFRTLAAGLVADEEIERFLAAARLPELAAGDLDQLNITAADGVIDLAAAPKGLLLMLYSKVTRNATDPVPRAPGFRHHPAVPGRVQPALGPADRGEGVRRGLHLRRRPGQRPGPAGHRADHAHRGATRAGQIARMTDLPAIVDADTGFGEPMNVARSVQELENAGLAGLHIEDQFNPKRCGHLDGKNVVDLDTATKRIRAAADARRDPNFLIMARTDIRATDGLGGNPGPRQSARGGRCRRHFPRLMDLDEFQAIRDAVDVPILANMTEFGQSALFTVEELAGVGVNMVIYPVTLLRSAMGAAERTLESIKADGTQEAQVGAC